MFLIPHKIILLSYFAKTISTLKKPYYKSNHSTKLPNYNYFLSKNDKKQNNIILSFNSLIFRQRCRIIRYTTVFRQL